MDVVLTISCNARPLTEEYPMLSNPTSDVARQQPKLPACPTNYSVPESSCKALDSAVQTVANNEQKQVFTSQKERFNRTTTSAVTLLIFNSSGSLHCIRHCIGSRAIRGQSVPSLSRRMTSSGVDICQRHGQALKRRPGSGVEEARGRLTCGHYRRLLAGWQAAGFGFFFLGQDGQVVGRGHGTALQKL